MAKEPLDPSDDEQKFVVEEWIKPNGMKYCIFCKFWNGKGRDTCRLCDANLISYVPVLLAAVIGGTEYLGYTHFLTTFENVI